MVSFVVVCHLSQQMSVADYVVPAVISQQGVPSTFDYRARLAGTWTCYENHVFRSCQAGKAGKAGKAGQTRQAPYTRMCELKDAADWTNLAKILVHQHEDTVNMRTGHYAIMRNPITPIWEHRANEHGGALQILVQEQHSANLLLELAARLVTDQLMPPEHCDHGRGIEITGMTFEPIDELHYPRGMRISLWNGELTTQTKFLGELTESARALVRQGKLSYVRHKERGNFGAYRR